MKKHVVCGVCGLPNIWKKKNIFGVAVYIREGFCLSVLLHFVQMRGGKALPEFFYLFISAFLVNKRSLFPPNANNLNF